MSSSIKALKLVIAAIMSLKERNGSSLQSIAHYLRRKYSVNQNIIKPLVYTGLIKGMKYGLIKNELGYYRLNPVLNTPLRPIRPLRGKKDVKSKKQAKKQNKRLKKQKFRRRKDLKRSSKFSCCSHKSVKRKKTAKSKPKRKQRRVIKKVKAEKVKTENEERQTPEQLGKTDDKNMQNSSSV